MYNFFKSNNTHATRSYHAAARKNKYTFILQIQTSKQWKTALGGKFSQSSEERHITGHPRSNMSFNYSVIHYQFFTFQSVLNASLLYLLIPKGEKASFTHNRRS